MLTAVDGKHDDVVIKRAEVQGVWEAPQNRSPRFAAYFREGPWMLTNPRHCIAHCLSELRSEAMSSSFVPTLRFERLGLRLWTEADGPLHRRP